MGTNTNAAKKAPRSNLTELSPPELDRELTCSRFGVTQAMKKLLGMWKTPVLLLLLDRPHRFAEMERVLAPISAKVLAHRLKDLERQGLVTRREIVSDPPKTVEYRLTSIGEALRPAFDALAAWSLQHGRTEMPMPAPRRGARTGQ